MRDKNHLSLIFGLFFWLFFVLQGIYCRHTGFKYFKNYDPDDYDLQPQNWSILQDKRGIIYVGNQGGLLEYDGVSWRFTAVPNRTVRSLAMDETGTIYVGGKNEIGCLAPTSNRGLEYKSLLHHINENQRNFGNVWKAHCIGKMVYFRTSKYLFRWNPASGHMHVWEPRDIFVGSFVCEGKLLIFQRNVGLMHLIKDSLQLVPGSGIFAGKWITAAVPYDEHRMLIGTFSDGLYLYDGSTFTSFPTAADEYIKRNQLYHGIGLSFSPGDFALATEQGGLVIIDSNGRLKYLFNKTRGLQDENVKYVFEDSQGNVWLTLDNGISKVENISPLSIYDNRDDLPGLVLSVLRHGPHNDLLVGTTSGLYSFEPDGKFRLIPGVPGMCWSLLSIDSDVFAATSRGMFQVDLKTEKLVETSSFVLCRSREDANRIWVGTGRGLVSVYGAAKGKMGHRQWEKEYAFENIPDEIRTIVEDNRGRLWLGTLTRGVLNIVFPDDFYHPVVKRYGTAHGLPRQEAHVFMAAGHVMVGTGYGLFRFDEKSNGFIPDYTLGDEFANGSRNVFRLVEDREKNIWFHSSLRNFQAIAQPDGTFVILRKPFLRIPEIQVNNIYPDPSTGTTWFAGQKGLIRFDTGIKKDYHQSFRVFIRRVLVNGRLVFDGYRGTMDNDIPGNGFLPVIDYKDRNLRFMFAAPFFEAESQTRYRFYLVGYDREWSGWTSETRKDYTNLDDGFYTFRVQAKNVYENVSGEDMFQFKVLPPWYRTWWAFACYALGFFLLIFFIVRWRSGKLVREKQRLEQIVDHRTKEIKEKNRQLEEQSEKLKEMDRVKSRFFANISHEFRTPLTLIMGPLEQVLSEHKDRGLEKNINLALQNSQRLLTLINQLLDLSRLDSGKMRLRARRQDVIPFLKGVVGSFESLAVQKKLDLTFKAEKEAVTLYYDAEKLEKVIGNLVANAAKFTPAGGKITVSAKAHPTGDENYPSGYLEIRICDTGIGIPGDQLPYIFDRFYQAEDSWSRGHKSKGTGIGLALVKELVELHHGEIVVQSTGSMGTEFTLRLSLGPDHLRKEEVADAGEFLPAARETNKVPVDYMVENGDAADGAEIGSEEVQGEDHEKEVILVVEDNADVRKYIRGPLENHYTVVEAADGQEGIDRAGQLIPDLIVSDVMMPKKDGYQLCDVLKKDVRTSHIPIVLLTAKASEESIIEGLETGADDYIIKPFNTKILLTRLKNLIDLRRQLQQKIQREMVLQPSEIAVSSMDHQFMEELKEVLEKNIADEAFGIDELAKALYMGRATLNRKIRALTGESTKRFIQSYRLKRAAQLLKANFGNVTEVAFEVGFSSSAYFTKCFKEKFHQLPRTYQASEAS